MTVVNRVYITDELLQSLGNVNIPNIDLAHNPVYNTSSMIYNEMYGSFYNNQNVVSISNISNEITNMGRLMDPWDAGVFANCTNLVNAPDLSGCNNLLSVEYAFINCTNLVNAPVLPNSGIGMEDTFRNCTNLVNAPVIPNGVTKLLQTFSGCTSLVNAPEIPNTVWKMEETFFGCTNLVNVPSLANTDLERMTSTFYQCHNLVNAPAISNYVTYMTQTFGQCWNLVNAPDLSNCSYLTDIQWCFMGCSSLENAPALSNSITNMSQTFSDCYNLVNAPTIPNSVTNMYETFFRCGNITNISTIPNFVTDMYRTFYQCWNLSGDITILSEEVKDASECFAQTYANKTVMIPFNMSHSETYTKGYYWETQSGKIIYTTTDFYSLCMMNPYSWNYEYNPKDENFGYLNGTIQYQPDWMGGGTFTINYEINGTWYSETITYDSSKNVIVTKVPGDSSFTYDSFIAAGYDTVNRVDGVLLKDINDRGSIMFDVTPVQDTSIYVDGELLSGYGLQTSTGEHNYTLVNPNYVTYYGTVNVTRGNTTIVTKDLTQITGHSITINTSEPNCTVTINGETATAVTSTQYVSKSLYSESSREINYSVEKSGYYTESGSVVFNNANIVLNVNLESSDIDLSNWNYSTDEFGNVILEDYKGSDVETLVIPNVRN